MKLFIWCDPYHVPYGQSMFFAVADTVEQAREMAKEAPVYEYFRFEQKTTPARS